MITKVFGTLERNPQVEKAIASITSRLGLNSRGGGSRTPIDLLLEARGALDRPIVGDGRAVSVLVSLRECIDAAITELVRRRPTQEAVKGWSGKVVSVGSRIAVSFLVSHFERLGVDGERLMNELSGAKQAAMTRDILMQYFNRGLLFLNALMESIDEARLRRNEGERADASLEPEKKSV